MISLDSMCAKSEPFQSIPVHGIVSGVTAQVLFSQFLSPGTAQKLERLLRLSEEETANLIGYLVSLHDIGKLAPRFMERIASPELYKQLKEEDLLPRFSEHVRHEKTTQQLLKTMWKKEGAALRTLNFYSGILGAHHQGKSGNGEGAAPLWEPFQQEMEQRMRNFFGPVPSLPEVPKNELGFLGSVLLGLTVLADWISSGAYFGHAQDWMGEPDFREKVREQAIEFLRKSGLMRQALNFGETFCSVWPDIPEDGMRPLQKETEALFRQTEERISLLLLEAPMGEGKTEAGMYAALCMAKQWQKNGFYIGLPTAATSNQMVGRIRRLLEQHNVSERVRLLHAMAWLADEEIPNTFSMNDSEEEDAVLRWLEPVRRGLLSSCAVGTVDQAMMSVLMVKYGVLRLLGLSGKVLVIDELHAYDAYMSGILVSLLEWCKALEIPVVLLSATLPPEKKQEMLEPFLSGPVGNAYPAITAVTESGSLLLREIPGTARRQIVQTQLLEILHCPSKIAEEAVRLTRDGGCLCILLNTVRQAQEVYAALKEQATDVRLLLFHAQFPAARRDEIEKECLRLFGPDKSARPAKAILAATQVVEQSLDIDMDFMLTAAAPIDLLLQRAGRMFRHENTPRPGTAKGPVLRVLVPPDGDFGADGFVYPECLLRQNIHLLDKKQEIRIPEDMAQLVADGYNSEKAPPDELESWLERLMDDQVQKSQGTQYLLGSPYAAFRPIREPEQLCFDDLEQNSYLSAKTRLGEPSRRIALLEPELYEKLSVLAEEVQGRRCIRMRSRELAREVLRQSVSVREKRLSGLEPGIYGKGLLEDTDIFPAEQGVYQSSDGRRIVFDPEFGVLWKGGAE